jgi:glycerol-3-phosphate cytidylyltransferase
MNNVKNEYNQTDTMVHDIFTEQTKRHINNIKNKYNGKKIVFTASCFDLLHPGHCLMLEDAKSKGDILIVGLHSDPTINRDNKNKPVQSFIERSIMINSCKWVDDVIDYATESDLYKILIHLNPDIRVLGTDWENKSFTGCDLPIPVHFHKRTHSWSTSGLRKRVFLASSMV